MEKRYEHIVNKYHHRFLEERFKDMDINRSEAPYLKVISKYGSIKMNELINKFFFHKSHTTRVVKSLVNQGYILKDVDPEDKRGYILTITEKGKNKASKITKVLNDWENLMDSFLTKDEKEFIDNLHKKIYEQLRVYFKEEREDD